MRTVSLLDCASLSSDQSRLFEQAEAVDFQFGLDWFRLLATSALTSEESGFLAMADDDQPRALLPLLARPARHELSALATWYSALYAPLLDGPDQGVALSGLLSDLRRAPEGWHSLRLAPLAVDAADFTVLRGALRRAGWAAFPFFAFGNGYLPCRGLGFDAYLAGRPGRLRHTLQRKTRRFLAAPGHRLELVTGGEGLEAAIRDWVAVYERSWKQPEPFPDFMPGLIRLAARRGWLRLGLAYQGDIAIAAQVWIVQGGRAAIYKLAQDQAHDELSPGTVLTGFLMRQVLDRDQVGEVDYLIGDEPYKQDWMSHRRERWGLMAYNPATPAGLAGVLGEGARYGVKRLLAALGLKDRGRIEPCASSPPCPPPRP